MATSLRKVQSRPSLSATRVEASAWLRAILSVLIASAVAGVVLRAAGFVGGAYSWFMMSGAGDDSWAPMALAYARAVGPRPESMFDVFFVDKLKFQYPPSSLLIYGALDALGIPATSAVFNGLVWLSVLGTAAAIFLVCTAFIDRDEGLREQLGPRGRLLVATGFGVATLFFYPVMICWRLGQIQAVINVLFALACLLWIRGRSFAAGASVGVICLIKPQFALFLLWGVLRRHGGFVAGQLAVLVPVTLLAVLQYGLASHIEYVRFLAMIAQHGEIYWDNTSVNGFVNRLLHPDQTLKWTPTAYPPYSPLVHAATTISTLVIVGAVLFGRRQETWRGTLFDLMLAGLGFTAAAPIAWGHHYGVVLPMLAVVPLACLRLGEPGRISLMALWAVCFLLFANNWNVSDALAGSPLSVFQSWRLAAALALGGLLWHLRSREREAARPQAEAIQVAGWA